MKIHTITKDNSVFNIKAKENCFDEYYQYEDICSIHPTFGKNCFGRDILKKYKNELNDSDFNYIVYANNTYTFYNNKFSKAKLFFKKNWVDNILKKPEITINIPEILKIEMPDCLNNNGEKLIIRSDIKKEELYFNIKSVGKVFGVKDLNKNIKIDTSIYNENEDYVVFVLSQKNKTVSSTYFTLDGFMKYIYNTRYNKANEVRKWANRLIYTTIAGTTEQKINLITKDIIKTPEQLQDLKTKLGVSINHYKQTIATLGVFSCIYLIILKEQKNTYIVKFGLTNNLKRRLTEHYKCFGNVYVKLCRYIDNSKLAEAEKELHNYFNAKHGMIETWPENDTSGLKRKEVFEIKKSEIVNVRKIYDSVSIKYGNIVKDINKDFSTLEENTMLKINAAEHTNLLKIKDLENECKLKTQEIENQKIHFTKDIENLNLKLELASFKLTLLQK